MVDELDIVASGMAQKPVDIIGIIRELGVSYEDVPMPVGESGLIEHKDGQYCIYVNIDEGPQRRRFTAAHELAHFLLHRDILKEKGGLNRHSDRLYDEHAGNNPFVPFSPSHEVEANRVAAAILMPATSLKETYDNKTDNFSDLAEDYNVSKTAMKIRLETLGLRKSR